MKFWDLFCWCCTGNGESDTLVKKANKATSYNSVDTAQRSNTSQLQDPLNDKTKWSIVHFHDGSVDLELDLDRRKSCEGTKVGKKPKFDEDVEMFEDEVGSTTSTTSYLFSTG